MMQEDKLSKQERLRLECFAQACNSSFTIQINDDQRRPTLDNLFDQAKKIEEFLKASNPN